ncbi:MAG TPA: FAD-binding protein, partial [Anaerolineaceae bacterium]|nr:FAD-binding protein [Anaerolineaceae bacterium]
MFVGLTEGLITQQDRQAEAKAYRLEKLAGQSKPESRLNGQLVVIGGGMAGLAAAHVAAQVFSRVTIVERDETAGEYDFRPGVPQARHTHNLLPEGLAILERLFPGIIAELIVSGAVPISPDQQHIFSANPDRNPSNPNRSGQSVYASRPL